MPLTPVLESHDADSVINDTTAFIDSRWLEWNTAWYFSHMTLLVLTLASCDVNGIVNGTIAFLRSRWSKSCATWSCDSMIPLYSLTQNDWNEIQLDILVMWHYWYWHWHHVMPMAPLYFIVQDDKSEMQHPFWWCDAIGTVISITWYQCPHKWLHYIPWVKMIKMNCNMTFLDHVRQMVPGLKSHGVDGIDKGTITFLISRQLKWDAT